MRVAGVVYVAYLVLAIAGLAFASRPLSVIATGVNFVLAIFLYRSFGPADPGVALALLPLAGLHSLIQGIGQVQSDADAQRLALLFFGLFLVVLGYLVARSTLMPLPLAYALVVAGMGWCTVAIPGLPVPLVLVVTVFGVVTEIVFALLLLTSSS